MTSNVNNLKLDFNKISSVHFFKSEDQSPLETPTNSEKDQQDEQLSPLKKKALMFYSRLGKSIDFANSPKDFMQTQKPQLLQKIDIVNTYKVKHLQNGIQKEQKYEAVNGSNNQFKLNFGYNSVLPQKNLVENDYLTHSLQLDFRKPYQQQQQQQQQQTQTFIHSHVSSATTLSTSIRFGCDQEIANKSQFQSCARNGKKHSSLKFQHQITNNQQQIQQDKLEKYSQQRHLIINAKKQISAIDTDQQLNNGLSIFKNEFIQKVASLTSIQSPDVSQRNSFSTFISQQNQKQQQQDPVTFQDHTNFVLKRKPQNLQEKNNYLSSKTRLKYDYLNQEQTPNSQAQKSTIEFKNQSTLILKNHHQNQSISNSSNIVNYFIQQAQSPSKTQKYKIQTFNNKQANSSSNLEDNSYLLKQNSFSEQIKKNLSPTQSMSQLDKSEKSTQSPKSAIELTGLPLRLNNMQNERRIKLFQFNNQFYPSNPSKQGNSLSPSRSKTNIVQTKINENLEQQNSNKQVKKNNILYSKLNSIHNKQKEQNQNDNEETILQIYPEPQQIIKAPLQMSSFENLSQKIKNSSLTTIQSMIKKEVNKIQDITITADSFNKGSQNAQTLNQSDLQISQKQKNDNFYFNSNFLYKQNQQQPQKIIIIDQKEKEFSPEARNTVLQLSQINQRSSNFNQNSQFEDANDSPSRRLNSIQLQNIEQRYKVKDLIQQRSLSQIQLINSRQSFTYINGSLSNTPQQKFSELKSDNTFSDLVFQNSNPKNSNFQIGASVTPKNQDPEKNRKILKCLFLKNPQDSPFKLIQKQRKIKGSNNDQLQTQN